MAMDEGAEGNEGEEDEGADEDEASLHEAASKMKQAGASKDGKLSISEFLKEHHPHYSQGEELRGIGGASSSSMSWRWGARVWQPPRRRHF